MLRSIRFLFLRTSSLDISAAARFVHTMSPKIVISSCFDAGNIEVDSISAEEGCKLKLRPEPFTHGTDNKQHAQWFYFKAANIPKVSTKFSIGGLLSSSYPEAWPGYLMNASYDRENWFRIDNTTYDEATGILNWKLEDAKHSQIYFAYFAPYSYERHQDLIAKCIASDLTTVEVLGSTLDGRDMELVTAGTGPLKIWLNARQHPGESMAEWMAEGFLNRLLDPNDACAAKLLRVATVYCVPNMNPDGSFRGHLRTNACGANLNREWATTTTKALDGGEDVIYEAPTLERSPEVYHVLNKLKEVGCDCYVDTHGDEEIPAVFYAGTQGIPNWTPRLEKLFASFSAATAEANPDFQRVKGYGDDEPWQANLAICGDQIAQRFDCLAVTLEMPYKDSTFDTPMPICGWTPQRSQKLGATLIDAFLKVAPELR